MANQPSGIYIHIPFCERKCTYCNFNTTDYLPELAQTYVHAVAQEIKYWGGRAHLSVDSIYLGGGTPSIITSDQIAYLMAACDDAFEITKDVEITIEINPGTMSQTKMREWRRAGINRASVGV